MELAQASGKKNKLIVTEIQMDEVDQIEQMVGQALDGVAAGIEVLQICETTEGRWYYTQPNIANL